MSDFSSVITVPATPVQVLDRVSQVSSWWASDFSGDSRSQGDQFTVRFGPTWVDFRVAEVVPERKVVWEVTDCYLHWIDNKTEWTGTKIEWTLTTDVKGTQVLFTHHGLVPQVECFQDCVTGWTFYIQKSLAALITENRGLPDQG